MSKKFTSSLTLSLAIAGILISPRTGAAASFDGPYAGLSVGAGILNEEGSLLAGPFEDKNTSAMAGGIFGMRTSVGNGSNLVVGIEADVNHYTKGSDWRYGISA